MNLARPSGAAALTLLAIIVVACAGGNASGNGGGDPGGNEDGVNGNSRTADPGGIRTDPAGSTVVLTPAEQAEYDAVMGALLGSDGLSGGLGQYWPTGAGRVALGALYAQPSGVIAYEGRAQASACGVLDVDNAWYCRDDRSLYYDDNLLRTLARAYGKVAPTIVLAHEWGHHIQAEVMGVFSSSVATELQADCLAGMYVASDFVPPTNEADLRTAGVRLFQLAERDQRGSDWFSPDVHGSAAWRGKAFVDGMLGVGAYCRDYADWEDRGPEPIGNYAWQPAPGMRILRAGNVLAAYVGPDQAVLAPVQPAPLGLTASTYLPAAFENWFDGRATSVDGVVELPASGASTDGSVAIIGGTAAFWPYQGTDTAGAVEHGLFLVHVAATGEAAVVNVFKSGPAPDTVQPDPAWTDLVDYMLLVTYGLCPSGGLDTVCDNRGS